MVFIWLLLGGYDRYCVFAVVSSGRTGQPFASG